jgi:hypothetical protein
MTKIKSWIGARVNRLSPDHILQLILNPVDPFAKELSNGLDASPRSMLPFVWAEFR